MENKEKEIFDKMQEKQARLAKKMLLGMLCGIGAVFMLLALIFLSVGEPFPREMIIVFLAVGAFLIVLGVILYFAIPTKYSYEKYKARTEKYGVMNVFELNAKLAELEARIEDLEKRL